MGAGGVVASPPDKQDIAAWLRKTTPNHLELLDGMRSRLQEALEQLPEKMPPDRDWVRVYRAYAAGFHALVADMRESAKLALLAQRAGQNAALSDDELATEMRALAREALPELSADELAAEAQRRGLRLAAPTEDE